MRLGCNVMVKHDAVELVTSAAFKKEIIMEKIDVTTLHDNLFTTIGKEWMLVAAGNEEKFNMMTASWGCLGWLWNHPVAIVYIRPERYTHEFIEANDTMSLVFLGNSEEARKAYAFCGAKSGRDFDKAKEIVDTAERQAAEHWKRFQLQAGQLIQAHAELQEMFKGMANR